MPGGAYRVQPILDGDGGADQRDDSEPFAADVEAGRVELLSHQDGQLILSEDAPRPPPAPESAPGPVGSRTGSGTRQPGPPHLRLSNFSPAQAGGAGGSNKGPGGGGAGSWGLLKNAVAQGNRIQRICQDIQMQLSIHLHAKDAPSRAPPMPSHMKEKTSETAGHMMGRRMSSLMGWQRSGSTSQSPKAAGASRAGSPQLQPQQSPQPQPQQQQQQSGTTEASRSGGGGGGKEEEEGEGTRSVPHSPTSGASAPSSTSELGSLSPSSAAAAAAAAAAASGASPPCSPSKLLTPRQKAEELEYRLALCWFNLADQKPEAYLDPTLPLAAAAFNTLAFECVFSKPGIWCVWCTISCVAIGHSTVTMIGTIAAACPGLDNVTHPEYVAGHVDIWFSNIPTILMFLYSLHAFCYRGYWRQHHGELLVHGCRLPFITMLTWQSLAACGLLAADLKTAEAQERTCLIRDGSYHGEERALEILLSCFMIAVPTAATFFGKNGFWFALFFIIVGGSAFGMYWILQQQFSSYFAMSVMMLFLVVYIIISRRLLIRSTAEGVMNDKRGYDAALQCHAGMAGGDLSQSDDVLELEQLANSLKHEAKVNAREHMRLAAPAPGCSSRQAGGVPKQSAGPPRNKKAAPTAAPEAASLKAAPEAAPKAAPEAADERAAAVHIQSAYRGHAVRASILNQLPGRPRTKKVAPAGHHIEILQVETDKGDSEHVHPINDRFRLFSIAWSINQRFQDHVNAMWAEPHCGTHHFAYVKAVHRVYQKVNRAYGGRMSRVLDIVRTTITFPDLASLCACLHTISTDQRVKVLRVKNRYSPDFDGEDGYRDCSLLVVGRVLTRGFVCEVQLNLETMYTAKTKGGGHKRYITSRDAKGS